MCARNGISRRRNRTSIVPVARLDKEQSGRACDHFRPHRRNDPTIRRICLILRDPATATRHGGANHTCPFGYSCTRGPHAFFVRCVHRGVYWLLAATLGVACAFIPLVLSAQTAPLQLVSTAWPRSRNASGQPRFALDLVEAALGRIALPSKTDARVCRGVHPGAALGRFDGSAAVWKDPQRETGTDLLAALPREPAGARRAPRPPTSPRGRLSALAGKRIAIVEGYSYGDALDRSGVIFQRTRSEEDSLARLLRSDVDYTLMDDLVVQYIVSAYPKESGTRLEIGSTPLVTRPLHLRCRRSRLGRRGDRRPFQHADPRHDRGPHLPPAAARRLDPRRRGRRRRLGVRACHRSAGPRRTQERVHAVHAALETATTTKPGFYVGGNIYRDWASVPESARGNRDSSHPDSQPVRRPASSRSPGEPRRAWGARGLRWRQRPSVNGWTRRYAGMFPETSGPPAPGRR
jgi:hypothetical protein